MTLKQCTKQLLSTMTSTERLRLYVDAGWYMAHQEMSRKKNRTDYQLKFDSERVLYVCNTPWF